MSDAINTVIKLIGHIETPYKTLEECPLSIENDGPLCTVLIDVEWQDALLGLEAGMHILVLYWFNSVDRLRKRQHSRKDGTYAGVFALRTPNRPNPIGAAVVKIETIHLGRISVKGLDCLDGTPLLDIKPATGRE